MKLYAPRAETVRRRITVELDQDTAAALDRIEALAKASGQQMQLGAAVADYIRRQVRAEVNASASGQVHSVNGARINE
jgi:predicted transcriptional regulator